MKVQVRLGVDPQVLAEKRGEVQDPLVNLDNLVGRQLSARLSPALRGGLTVIRDGRRVQPGELGDDELDRVQTSVDARGGFTFVLAALRGGDGGGEIVPAVDVLERPVGRGVPDGERGRVRELLLQCRHEILVRDHGGNDEGADVGAGDGFHRHGGTPGALLRLAPGFSFLPGGEDLRGLLLARFFFRVGVRGALLGSRLGRFVE